MFSRTLLRLTGLYLAILMAICIIFSVPIYELSVNELNRSFRTPDPVLDILRSGDYSRGVQKQINQEYEELYQAAKKRVLNRLILVNIIILLGGGFVSYYLAKRTLKPIEEAHESMKRFTADASHELRTPITAMQTENEVTLMDSNLTLSDAKAQLQSNIEELGKLTLLSEGLLRLARLEAGEQPKEKVPAGLIARLAIENMSPLADKKNLNIRTDLLEKSDTIQGDANSLVEAVVILLDNAIKHSPNNSIIKVKTVRERGCLIIKVSDQGPGIRKADQVKIFDRFYRADASRSKNAVHGYGLGLAIAKNIVAAHGGTITVDSRPGKGSSFSIKLPVAK